MVVSCDRILWIRSYLEEGLSGLQGGWSLSNLPPTRHHDESEDSRGLQVWSRSHRPALFSCRLPATVS